MNKERIRFDFKNIFCSAVGRYGIQQEELDAFRLHIPGIHAAMEEKRAGMAWRALPYQDRAALDEVKRQGELIRKKFDHFVVLGIGGSALGPKALFHGCCHPFYNDLPKEKRNGPRFYVEDNIDPDHFQALLDSIDIQKTAFQIITKSGNTAETMAKCIIILELLKTAVGDGWQEHVFVTTDPEQGILRRMAAENGFAATDVPRGVGGRFSVLSPVGLLSAAVLGIDIEELLFGAAAMEQACRRPELYENPAYFYAAVHCLAMKQGVNVAVLMPYSEALSPMAEWHCQLWAESLGKRKDLDGNCVHCGQTQVRAVGAIDQHSQIQLYNEGPFDKLITLIGVENFDHTVAIPASPVPVYDAAYLCGHSLNELISAERDATAAVLRENGRMNMMIRVDRVDAYTVGALLFFFEMATAAAGEMLHIDAFNQPGVEAGKTAACALLGRSGLEEKRNELESAMDAVPSRMVIGV